MSRPDWVVCVASDVGPHHPLARKTWCGLPRVGFQFQGADHAALNGHAKQRLVACPACVEAIVAGLRNGHEEIPS